MSRGDKNLGALDSNQPWGLDQVIPAPPTGGGEIRGGPRKGPAPERGVKMAAIQCYFTTESGRKVESGVGGGGTH